MRLPTVLPAVLATCLLFSASLAPAEAQSAIAPQAPPAAVSADEYARAETFLAYNVMPLVTGMASRPTWLPDERFWYRNSIAEGHEFVLVDVGRRTRTRAFDHEKLAAGLSAAASKGYEPFKLPFQSFEFADDGRTMVVTIQRRRYTCDLQEYTCTAPPAAEGDREAAAPGRRPGGRTDVPSPDGTRTAFVRDFNLWVRDVRSGRETQLTTDGVKDFGYATDNAGWTRSDRPILLWSPDSKKIATFQHDGRQVGEMHMVETKVGRPTLHAWKYPLPGDDHIFTIDRVVIDVDARRIVRLQMAPDAHRSTLCDHVVCRGEWADVEWAADATHLAFVSSSRDHKRATLRVADVETGAVRDVLEETVPTYYESGNGRVNWRVLPATNEVIWFSERDDWGQLYLYDLRTGALKHQITSGEGNVTQLLHVDEEHRLLYFLGVGREPGRDPYFSHLYRIGMDGKGEQLLTPEDANHDVTFSTSGRYFVDSYSRPEVPPVTALRDSGGALVLPLEKGDISKLLAAGWQPPEPFTVKARDGQTDLYGLMFKPTRFDRSRKYPIINNIYPGPQTGSVGSRSFTPARGDTQALAELGFIVVQVDGMGTPWRSKSFHDAYYGNMGDNTLPDQVTAMKQLAQRHPWIDLDRAGIYGGSGGGYATAGAMFRYPDFFKVGVSQAGNHDNRGYEDDWAEKWQGLLQKSEDGKDDYGDQANQTHAKQLKGKLLLAHGTMDTNVPMYLTLLVVNQLIKANKDFDLLLLPNRGHGISSEPYMMRRRWDYFVRHLLGAEPPREYEFKPPAPPTS